MSAAPPRRIAWLEPSRLPFDYHDQNVYSGVLFPRAGPKMAALLGSLGHTVEVISGELSRIDPDAVARDFDLACISVISNTAPHGLILARWLGERGLPVVMGGYQFAHSAFRPETLQTTEEGLDFAPYVIRGEGYRALPGLLDALDGRRPLDSVGGLSYREAQGRSVHAGVARLLSRDEINELPPADWSCVRDRHHMRVTSVHGQQGCPRDCSFCAVWTRDGRANRNTAATRLVDELEGALAAGPFRHVFFSADNFPVFRDWAREICDEILRRGIRVSWTCQAEVRCYQATELVDRMVRAGCDRWCIGLESINPASLAGSHKKQTVEQMEACVAECRRRGIHVHGMFIVGLPHDTPESVRATVDWAMRQRLETVQFLCLSDLPGSPDYEQHELWKHAFRPFDGAYAPLNWMFVNGHYARVSGGPMSLAQVQDETCRAMLRFYGPQRTLAPWITVGREAMRAAREQGAGRLRAIRDGYLHNVVAGYLRLRGYRETRRWMRSPFNRAYRELLTASGARAEALRRSLLSHLPADWLRTLERVHGERLQRLARGLEPRLITIGEALAAG